MMIQKWKAFLALATAALLIGVVWCGILPWLSRQRHVQQRLNFLDERGIDPSAMYYTELDAMGPILDRMEGRYQCSTVSAKETAMREVRLTTKIAAEHP